MQKIALLVGVDDYIDERINNLSCCCHDAQEAAFTLRHHLGFDEAVALTQSVTTDKVVDQLARVGRLLKPGDLFVFFFAGHGKTHSPAGGERDQLFLLPRADVDLLSQQALAGATGILSWRALKALTDRWAGVQRLFIFDACRLPLEATALANRGTAVPAQYEGAGVFRGDFVIRRAARQSRGNEAPLAVINSCDDGEQAEELPRYPGGGHGKFTAALLEDLQAAAREGNGVRADGELAQRLYQRMQLLGPAHGGTERSQQPLWVGDAVVLAEPPLRQVQPPSPPSPPPSDVVRLLADFERQLAAGQIHGPWNDCCQGTLVKLWMAGVADVTLGALAQRLPPTAKADVPSPPGNAGPIPVAAPTLLPEKAWPFPTGAADSQDKPKPKSRSVMLLAVAGAGLVVVLAVWGGRELLRPSGAAGRPAEHLTALLPVAAPDASVAAPVSRYRGMEPVLQVAGCPACGQMSQVEAGEFNMGSSADEPQRDDVEGPVHHVKLARFEIGRTEVTQGQWRALMGRNPSHFQECGDACPVDNVSWDDITGPDGFLARLHRATGQNYRLPSEAEWEFGARAGTTTPFWWGQQITPRQANYDGRYLYDGGGEKGEYRQKTMRADSLEANAWGLYQVHGNVWEWVQDCWHDNYKGAPPNGAAWERDCVETRRVLRGGSWGGSPRDLRAAYRSRSAPNGRGNYAGFRLARTF